MPNWVTWSHFFPNLVLFVFDYSVVSALLNSTKKAGPDMNVRKKLAEERGQGLVEYTLIVLFVALVLWLGVKSTNAAHESLERNYRLCRQPFFLWLGIVGIA